MLRALVAGYLALSACGRIAFDPTSGLDGGAAPSVFTEVVLPDGASVSELARGADGTLYAALGHVRIVRSSNLGASWSDCGLVQGGIENIAVDPSSGAVYVAGPPGLLRSVDACATWSSTDLAPYTYYVTVFEGRVYAGTEDGLWLLGASWTRVPTPMDGHTIYEVDGDEPGGHLFLSGDNGLARSIDHGVSWALETAGLPANAVATYAAIDPADDQRVIISAGSTTAQNIYFSSDGGVTWGSLGRGGFAVAFDPSDSAFALFASYDYGLNASTDGGASFDSVRLDGVAQRSPIVRLVFDGSSGVYAASGRGVVYAPDHTLALRELDTGLDGWAIHQIVVSPAGTIYLATDAGVLSSRDDGTTWTEGVNGMYGPSQVNAVIPIPGTQDSIFAGSINAVERSDDIGQMFSVLYVLSATDIYNLFALSVSGTKLIVGTAGGVVIADAPWTSFNSVQLGGQSTFVPDVLAIDAMHLLAGGDRLFYSTDGGTSFNDVSTGTDLSGQFVTAIAQLPDGSLLVGTAIAGISRASSPNGPWSPSGFAGHSINALLASGSKTIAATDLGVFASDDNGVSWHELPGLATVFPQALAIGPAGELLVGTASSGLYRMPMP